MNLITIAKWVAIGSFAILGFTLVSYKLIDLRFRKEDEAARARSRQAPKSEDAKQAQEFKEIEARARANWATWRDTFTMPEFDGIVCAYGQYPQQKNFEISCQIGPKKSPPTYKVVCDQGGCKTGEVFTPPRRPYYERDLDERIRDQLRTP